MGWAESRSRPPAGALCQSFRCLHRPVRGARSGRAIRAEGASNHRDPCTCGSERMARREPPMHEAGRGSNALVGEPREAIGRPPRPPHLEERRTVSAAGLNGAGAVGFRPGRGEEFGNCPSHSSSPRGSPRKAGNGRLVHKPCGDCHGVITTHESPGTTEP